MRKGDNVELTWFGTAGFMCGDGVALLRFLKCEIIDGFDLLRFFRKEKGTPVAFGYLNKRSLPA